MMKITGVDLITVQREMRGRFVSSGGRPADPSPTISPGQLAAFLLERVVLPSD